MSTKPYSESFLVRLYLKTLFKPLGSEGHPEKDRKQFFKKITARVKRAGWKYPKKVPVIDFDSVSDDNKYVQYKETTNNDSFILMKMFRVNV